MTTSKGRITALLLMILGLILCFILFAQPLFSFDARVYTKKSSNTFKGDEKYKAALAEVEEVLAGYEAQGFSAAITEEETLRTNSKGETTSLISFSVSSTLKKSILSMTGLKLMPGYVAFLLTACVDCSFLAAACGVLLCMKRKSEKPDKLQRSLFGLAALFSVIALICVPVLAMTGNYSFVRKLNLYNEELVTQGREAFGQAIDRYLFSGSMGDGVDAALKQLGFSFSAFIWLLIPCIFLMLVCCLYLRYGMVKRALLKGMLYAFVVCLCVVVLYPYYVMFITAFRSNAETTDMYFLHMLPVEWVFSNMTDIINRGVPRYLMNSVMIAGGATIISLLCGIPAAYALSRMDFKGKKAFLGFVIMSQMFSPVVLLIGIAQLMSTLGLSDSIWGLMFINAAFNQAFAIWLLRSTFVSISPEMEQAAMIDGCNMRQSLTKVLLPMAAPGIVTVLIFVFINAWNEYTISTVLISTAENRPITVGITQFSSFNMIEWQYLFAASLLATLPVVILFMFIEKYLVSGLTSGGVKG